MDVNGDRVTVDLGAAGITVDGSPVEAAIEVVDGTPLVLLNVNGSLHRLAVRREGPRGRYAIWSDGYRFEAEALDERRRAIREMAGAGGAAAGPARLVAPMPGLVVRIAVQEGDRVQAGTPLVVMEAMKMENELKAPVDGVVGPVRVRPGEAVEKGAVLVELVATPAGK